MKLEKKHYEAMELELEGVNISEICRRVGINSRQTYYNWKKDSDYICAMDRLRNDFQKSTQNYISSKTQNYINKVEELINSPKTSEKVRAELLKYMINRAIGTPTAMQEVHTISEVEPTEKEFNVNQFFKDLDMKKNGEI